MPSCTVFPIPSLLPFVHSHPKYFPALECSLRSRASSAAHDPHRFLAQKLDCHAPDPPRAARAPRSSAASVSDRAFRAGKQAHSLFCAVYSRVTYLLKGPAPLPPLGTPRRSASYRPLAVPRGACELRHHCPRLSLRLCDCPD
jgi:hypothetical protein